MTKRILAAIAAVALVALTATALPADAAPKDDKGANRTGDFTPTDPKTTDPSNDRGNRPSDGSVGNADGKNPPGQSKGDKNSGYECDKNNGVGKGNPAHSACASTTTSKPTTPTTEKPKTPPTTEKPKTDYPGGTVTPEQKKAADAAAFEQRARELKAQHAGEVSLIDPLDATADAAPEGLAATGALTDALIVAGGLLLIFGLLLTASTKHWNPRPS